MTKPPVTPDFVTRYSGAAAFLMLALTLQPMNVTDEVPYIFGFLPAVLFGLAGYGTVRVPAAIVTQCVAIGIWWGLRTGDPGPLGLPASYVWPLLGAIAGVKLARTVREWPQWVAQYHEMKTWAAAPREELWFYGFAAASIGLAVALGSLVENTSPFGWALAGIVFVWIVTRFLTVWAERIVHYRRTGAWPAGTVQDLLAYLFAALVAAALAVLFGTRTLRGQIADFAGASPYVSALIFFALVVASFAATAFMARHVTAVLLPAAAETDTEPGKRPANAIQAAAPFFALLGLAAFALDASYESVFVFGIAPAALCVFVGKLLPALITEAVLVILWFGSRIEDGLPKATDLHDPVLLIYVGAAAITLVVINVVSLLLSKRRAPKDAAFTVDKVPPRERSEPENS